MESNRDLKHLSFVATSSEKLSQAFVQNGLPAVESVYKMAKTYVVPSIVHPEINRLEETLGATVPPLAAKASDAADRLLHYADQKVFISTESEIRFGHQGLLLSILFLHDFYRWTTLSTQLTEALVPARRCTRPT
jgi:hypothetical protein